MTARAASKTTPAKVTARKRAANAAKPKVDNVTQLAELFAKRLSAANVSSKTSAEALGELQRRAVCDVQTWGDDESAAFERVVATLPDDLDDDSSDDDSEHSTPTIPLRPLTTDPELQSILDTITGDTPQAVDYAYKAAFELCCPEGSRVPPREIMTILAEQHRRVHEAFVTSRGKTRRSSTGERKPKGEFQPFVQAVLDWMEQHFTEHGAATGLRVKEIAEGMSKHPGTTWHAVRILTAAHRLRTMPDDAKRFTFFPSAQPVETESVAS